MGAPNNENTNKKYDWDYKTRKESIIRFLKWLFGAIIFLIAARYISENTMWVFVWSAPEQAVDFVSRMYPPDVGYFRRVIPALWDTVNIAVFGTLMGVVIALPVSVFAAKNTTPHRILRLIAMTIIVTSRSVNSLIWGLLIVQIVGPGLFAGVLAIGVRGVGMISKLFYETIEEIDPKPIEAIKATGASQPQVLLYGYLPQLIPAFVGVSIYRWEINIRESTIIGLVGGGGIGFLLNSAINRLRWDQAIIILVTILGSVLIAEWVSARIRSYFT